MAEQTQKWRIVVGGDRARVSFKEILEKDLRGSDLLAGGAALAAVGTAVGVDAAGHTPYPKVAVTAAEMVARGEADRALLICGTGLGVAISANKVAGIRAVTAHDSYSVERSVLSNNAQVLCMGQRVVGIELARRLAKEWLGYQFDPASASAARVSAITGYEPATGAADSYRNLIDEEDDAAHGVG